MLGWLTRLLRVRPGLPLARVRSARSWQTRPTGSTAAPERLCARCLARGSVSPLGLMSPFYRKDCDYDVCFICDILDPALGAQRSAG